MIKRPPVTHGAGLRRVSRAHCAGSRRVGDTCHGRGVAAVTARTWMVRGSLVRGWLAPAGPGRPCWPGSRIREDSVPDSEILRYTLADGVLRLQLNRPEKRNAMNASLANALYEGMQRADDDPDVRVIVIAGSGGAFSAGADMNEALAAFESGDRRFNPAARAAQRVGASTQAGDRGDRRPPPSGRARCWPPPRISA